MFSSWGVARRNVRRCLPEGADHVAETLTMVSDVSIETSFNRSVVTA
jgi:hypothetical protein